MDLASWTGTGRRRAGAESYGDGEERRYVGRCGWRWIRKDVTGQSVGASMQVTKSVKLGRA